MTHRPLIAALAFSLMGCPGPTPPVPTTCEADPNWITNPTMPSEVPEAETFCDFYQFSWQWFLAQASPSESGDPVFMQNRVYSPTGGSGQCSDPPITGIAGAISQLIPRQGKPNNFEDAQADGNALYDQNGNVLYYNAFYSQEYCSSTAAGFAPGSMEAKVSWRVLQEGTHHTYYTISAFLPGYDGEVTLGLAGLHLAIWTPNHPEMIWATWEHKTNAPLCNGTSDTTGWSLASDAAATCLATTTNETSGPPPASCNSFGFNVPATHPTGAAPITGDAINVCRQYAHGNQEGTAVNGNDNAANLAAITELNEALVGDEGLITKLPGDSPLSVWANYEMIGAIWTKDGADSGPPPVPSTQAQGPGNADSPQRGSLELTNMTLETFQQGDTSAIPNCFGCHNYTAENPLGVSHIQYKLLPTSAE
jgi:hypothetical protein